MESKLVLGGRFRVFEDGSINRVFDGVESPAKTSFIGKGKRYQTVSYYDETGKQRHVYVHRLVAAAFIPNPENKSDVSHKNGDLRDNSISNLVWSTPSERTKRAYENGLINPMATATPCTYCGSFTKAKGGICTRCRRELAKEANDIDRAAEQADRYSGIDPRLLTSAEKRYVQCAANGMTVSEISRVYGVSRQCVSAALLFAEKKNITGIRMPNSFRDAYSSYINRLMKKKRKMEAAKIAFELAQNEYEDAKNTLEKFEEATQKTYCVERNESISDDQDAG